MLEHGAPEAYTRFDVVVVGGGPAGATAARGLAALGHRVLLLEKEALPRYKPCGGGLGPKSVRLLPFPVEEVPHVRLDRIDFRLRGECPVTWELPEEFPFYMVMRADLDHRLVQAASEAGAEVHAPEAVRSVEWDGEAFLVTTDRAQYSAPYLVGADGALGAVRHSLGIDRRSEQGIALECEVEVPRDVYAPFATTAIFDVEAAPDGYGWIFPKPAHLSVGIGSLRPSFLSETSRNEIVGTPQTSPDGPRALALRPPPPRPPRTRPSNLPLRAMLRRFIEQYGLASGSVLDGLTMHAHPLPVASAGERARSGNALLTGDAAGVADGFGGEGICYSMASGGLAAETISRALGGDIPALDGYEAALDRIIRQDHRQANLMGRIVRRFPDAGYRILTSMGEGRTVLIPLLLGEFSFGEALRRLPRLLALDRMEDHSTGTSA